MLRFGKMVSGTVRNAISGRTVLEGSLRTYREDIFRFCRRQLQDIGKALEEETGCTVEIVGASWDDGLNKIMSAIASGEGPDVVQVAEQWAGQCYSSGAFMELDSHMDLFGGLERLLSGSA